MQAALDAKNARARDLRVPFKRFGVYLSRVTANTFKKSGRPGASWKPLSEYTLALRKHRGKRYSPHGILQDRGILRASFTAQVWGNGMKYGASVPYAAKHQFGGETLRERVEIRPRNKKALRFTVGGKEIFRKLVVLPAKRFSVPKRPMLTWFPEDDAELERLTGEYMEQG